MKLDYTITLDLINSLGTKTLSKNPITQEQAHPTRYLKYIPVFQFKTIITPKAIITANYKHILVILDIKIHFLLI